MSAAKADESVEEDIEGLEEADSEESEKLSVVRSLLRPGRARTAAIAGLALLLVAGSGAGAYVSGVLEPFLGAAGATVEPAAVVFYDLPDMVVNLQSGTKKAAYLKLRISLELDENADLDELKRLLPRVVDQYLLYLRELRVDDLSGSAGIYRIKEELLRRVAAAVQPLEVRDVLFSEMLIQ